MAAARTVYMACKSCNFITEQTVCPRCGGQVVTKKSKRGYKFYGCSNYPDCNFMTWDEPTAEKCPECGSTLFKQKGGVLACLKEDCGFSKKAQRSWLLRIKILLILFMTAKKEKIFGELRSSFPLFLRRKRLL